MPVDPRAVPSVAMPQIDRPLDVAAKWQQYRAGEQQRALAQEEAVRQRQTFAQTSRINTMKISAEERELAQDAKLREVFSGDKPPSQAQIYSIVGPTQGAKIMQGMVALQTEKQKGYGSTQEVLRDVFAGTDALPEPTRAALYPGIRQKLVTDGIIKPEDAPET